MPNEPAEPSPGPSSAGPTADELLRAARRRYFTIITVVAIGSVVAATVGLWGTGDRLRHHSWLFNSAIILLPATVLVITGLIAWRVQSRSGPTRQLLTSGPNHVNRQARANLRAGTTLTPEQRPVVQALVNVHYRRRWTTWAFGGVGMVYVVSAFLDQDHEFWFHLGLAAVWLTSVPINWLTTHLLVRRAAALGIQPVPRQPAYAHVEDDRTFSRAFNDTDRQPRAHG